MRTALKILAALLVLAGLIFLAYNETRPERRILIEENYQPPVRAQTPQAHAPAGASESANNLTPMPGDE